MKIKPVIIQVKNLENYRAIALLVDREDFLQDLYDFRRNLNLDKLLSIYDTAGVLAKLFLSKRKITNKRVLKKGISLNDLQKKLPIYSYFLATDHLMRKYQLGVHYFAIIVQALLSNKVVGNLYPNVYFLALNPKDEREKRDLMISLESEMNTNGDAKAILIINSRTTKKEIVEMLRQAKKVLPPVKDTISNIKRDRNWYWKNRLGTSALQIYNEGNTEISIKAIEKAITQYKKLIYEHTLKHPPTFSIL